MKHMRLLLTLLLLSSLASLTQAYTTRIYASAVIENENQGILTQISLDVTPGSGAVAIKGPSVVAQSTISSAQEAAQYASSFVGVNSALYNFTYSIDSSSNVSGPSAGVAFTLLAISGLRHEQLASNFSVTGTIGPDGTAGLIGGAYDKVGAAAQGGMHFILVPAAANTSFEDLLYYLSQQVYNIPVVQVANISQALPYALGEAAPRRMGINLTQDYRIGSLGNTTVTCSDCNVSVFRALLNSTLNFTEAYIGGLPANFSLAKQQLGSNLGEYKAIAGKGYLYTAADFSFLDFFKSFTLYEGGLSASDAAGVLSNSSADCSLLSVPPLTSANYEYVIGGRIRQLWANATFATAQSSLDAEQTSDDIIQSMYSAASALGWCQAADAQYNIASSLPGSYVSVGPQIQSSALSLINQARGFGTNMYLKAALSAYDSGDYATALYSAEYANVFGNPDLSANMTSGQMVNATMANMANATFGVWPSQFASQAQFYLYEARIARNSTAMNSYLSQAYSVSSLAAGLSAANRELSGSFVISSGPSAGSVAQLASDISSIKQQLSAIYLMIGALFVLLISLVIATAVMLHKAMKSPAAWRRQPGKRSRRRRR